MTTPVPSPTLAAHGLRVDLGERTVLPDLTLGLREGEVTAIVGPNGSGKSTALRTLARLLKPTQGDVLLDGRAIVTLSTRDIAKRLAILPQGPSTPPGITVRELVGYGRYPHQGLLSAWTDEDAESVDWALDVTGLAEFADRDVDALSGGERQRAWIAMALAQRTRVLLLDEPTTYLDMRYQLDVLNLVRELNRDHGLTVGVVLHDLNHAAAFSDRIVMLREGRIVEEGAPHEVLTSENVRHVFGVDVTILPHPETGSPYCLPCPARRAIVDATTRRATPPTEPLEPRAQGA